MNEKELQQNYEDFFEDIFWEMNDKYGDIEEMNVCDNLGDHLVGNIYIMFREEETAERAVNDLNNRWYAGTSTAFSELKPVFVFESSGFVYLTNYHQRSAHLCRAITCHRLPRGMLPV